MRLLDLSRKAIMPPSKETVDNVEERVTSRTLYMRQILEVQEQISPASRPIPDAGAP